MLSYDDLKIKDSEILTQEKWNGLVEKVEERDLEIAKALTIKDGNVGIGTDAPERALHIRGTGLYNDDLIIESNGSEHSGALIFNKSQPDKAPAKSNDLLGLVAFRGYNGSGYHNGAYITSYARSDYDQAINGDFRIITTENGQRKERLRIESNGFIGIGTSRPVAKLQITGGAIMPAAGNSENAGILFPKDAYGGGGDRAYIRYYRRGGSGEATTLEIANKNDGNDLIQLNAPQVHISSPNTTTSLHVKGPIRSYINGFQFPDGSIQSRASKAVMVSSGVVEMNTTGNSNASPLASGNKRHVVRVNLSGFTAPPHIIHAPYLFDVNHSRNMRLIVDIGEITKNGFNIHFTSWDNSVIYGCNVRWLAIGV